MALPLLAGGLTAALVLLLAWWWRSAPTRALCPRCGEDTAAVRGSGVAEAGEGVVQRRWCTACGWSGLGRAGPEWTPGRPSAHDSGFHWGDRRLPPDFGFRFAERPGDGGDGEPPVGPPDHPSGFRFSRDDRSEPGGWAFRWADASGTSAGDGADGGSPAPADGRAGSGTEPPGAPGERPGFRWRSPGRPRQEVPGFQWKDGDA